MKEENIIKLKENLEKMYYVFIGKFTISEFYDLITEHDKLMAEIYYDELLEKESINDFIN